MDTATTKICTFQPIIIHANLNNNEIEIDCKRDILILPSITLYQLYKFILISFDISEKFIEQHNFTLKHNNIETCFQVLNYEDIFLQEGFITPIAPGVYIEHSHPHEPLPMFSIHNKTDEINMSFRILRDERYINLDTVLDYDSILYFEFQYLNSKYNIQLEFKKLKLPIHFLKEMTNSSPKIINKQGQFFNNRHKQCQSIHSASAYYYNKNQELLIDKLCKTYIQKLNQERKLFVFNCSNNNNKCHWIESTGDICIYCNLY